MDVLFALLGQICFEVFLYSFDCYYTCIAAYAKNTVRLKRARRLTALFSEMTDKPCGGHDQKLLIADIN